MPRLSTVSSRAPGPHKGTLPIQWVPCTHSCACSISGLTTGIDGIGGQVFGAGQYGALGTLLQRAILVCSLACLPIYLLWSRTASILVLMGKGLGACQSLCTGVPNDLAVRAQGVQVPRHLPCCASNAHLQFAVELSRQGLCSITSQEGMHRRSPL